MNKQKQTGPSKTTRILGATAGTLAGLPMVFTAPVTGAIGYKHPGVGFGMLAGGALGSGITISSAIHKARKLWPEIERALLIREAELATVGKKLTQGEVFNTIIKNIKPHMPKFLLTTAFPVATLIAGGIAGGYIEHKLRQRKQRKQRNYNISIG